jgi:Tol biopolymer transport system component
MSIAAGSQLGPYHVSALLGAGGMGEVYRAQDPRLGRAVAIKILPATFATDPERLRRFEQEARAVAALNHANILAVHDVGSHEGAPYIVSELLEGETLRQRLDTAAMAIRRVVDCAVQVAHGLAAAHEKGVVHRDLKPENIFLTANDHVKILDFGLAKLMEREPVPSGSAATALSPDTAPGFVLGTVGYMAPEQVRGVAVDHRTDIFAFGTIVYEMLSGRRPFLGETSADTMTAILKEEPPDLPLADRRIPPALARVVDRCLSKNPAARFQSAGDLAFALESLSDHSRTSDAHAEPTPSRPRRDRAALIVAAALGIAFLALLSAAVFRGFRNAAIEDRRTFRFAIAPPDGWAFAGGTTQPTGIAVAPIAVSPDGWQIALVARDGAGKRQLWIHSRDALAAKPLAGTDNASSPFWSPDGQFVAFFADGKLKKMPLAGGPAITLCDAEIGIGGSWSSAGVIVFAPSFLAPLQKVPAVGGVPAAVTAIEEGELYHSRPSFLPDGKTFMYSTRDRQGGRSVYLGSLDSTGRRRLSGIDSSNVIYSRGHLLFVRDTTLMAQPFDPRRLELRGQAFPIAHQVQATAGLVGAFSASDDGVVAYQSGSRGGLTQLAWLDRGGAQLSFLSDPGRYGDVTLSPDGKQAAVSLLDESQKMTDIWIFDVARGTRTRLTTDAAEDLAPVWSPDGSVIAFASHRGKSGIYKRRSDGSGDDELLFASDTPVSPGAWSPDGRFLLYMAVRPGDRPDLFVLPLGDGARPIPVAREPGVTELPGSFSPDGRWISYFSDKTGRMEVYVAPFPGPGGATLVSTQGGAQPHWRGDGGEIVYVNGPEGRIMAAEVKITDGKIEVGTVRELFAVRTQGIRAPYDVTADGERFLVNIPVAEPRLSASAPVTVVVNWSAEFKK